MIAPTHSLPATLSTIEGMAVDLAGGVFISPPPTVVSDDDSAAITTRLFVADGSLTTLNAGGAIVTGAGTNDLTFTGSVEDVNLALYMLRYTPADGVSGTRTINVTTSDGALFDSDDIVVSITDIGVEPVGRDVERTTPEDVRLALSAADFPFDDVEGQPLAGIVLTTLPAHGRIIKLDGFDESQDIDGDGFPDLVVRRFDYRAGEEITRADLDAGLVCFEPYPEYSGPDSFTFQVRDGGGPDYGVNLDQSPNSFTIQVTAVDDPPVNTIGSGTITLDEDEQVSIDGLSIADLDSSGGLSVTLSALHGNITITPDIAGGVAAASISYGGDSVTLSGTLAQINTTLAAVDAVRYAPAADYHGADTLTMITSDGSSSDTDSRAISIAPINDAPTLAGFADSASFDEQLVNATPQLLDSEVTFADLEGQFDGGKLIVSGLLAEDRLAIRNEGVAPGEIGVSGGNVTYGNTIIGTFTGGTGSTFSVTFNAAATTDAVDALIENLTYANVSDMPAASRGLRLLVIDGAVLGAPLSPSFAELAGADNPFDGVDVGFVAAPSFIDLDGDGDMDAVIGSLDGTLRAFENVDGAFNQLVGGDNPFNGVTVGNRSVPAFVDLDADGDLDAVVGEIAGRLLAFENDGGLFSMASQLTGAANPFAGVDVGLASAPSFADLDGDGDLDAVVGGNDGSLRTFANESGVFTELTGSANPFDDVDVGTYSSPAFADLDGDGDIDAVVGDSEGGLRAFTNHLGAFTELTGTDNPFDGVDVGPGAQPAFADLDGDGDPDAVVGWLDGSLDVFDNVTPAGRTIIVDVAAHSLDAAGEDPTFTEDGPAADLFSTVAVDGFAGQTLSAMTLTVAGLADGADEILRIDGSDIALTDGHSLAATATSMLAVAVTVVGTTATLTVSGGTLHEADFQLLVDSLSYRNGSQDPTAGNRTVTITGLTFSGPSGAETLALESTVGVVAINDPPTGTSAVVTIDEDTSRLLSAADFGFGDVDGGFAALTVTAVSGGQLSYDGDGIAGAGVAVAIPAGTYPVTCTVAELADGKLSFRPTPNLNGPNTAVIGFQVIDDNEEANSTDPSVDFLTFSINPIDDAAVAQPDAFSLAENQIAVGSLFDNDDDLDGPALAVAAVNGAVGNVGTTISLASGARLRVNADGSYSYNPNHVFDYLAPAGFGAANSPATDDFTYALVNGNTVTVTVTITGIDGADRLIGTGGDDTMSGGGYNDRLFGLGGRDNLNGGSGFDELYGGEGDDTLDGGQGNDRLDGGTGVDMMTGGAGHDNYVVDHVGDVVVELGQGGTDSVESSISYSLPTHVEWLFLTGRASVEGRGNGAANKIFGNSGNNLLNGGKGDDLVDGGAGNDKLYGSEGNDLLIGGTGKDGFFFSSAPGAGNVDRILDFNVADDVMNLARYAFTKLGPLGTLNAGAFVLGTSAADADDRILYDAMSGQIYYDSDGAGAAAAILFATVSAGTPLTHADFNVYV